MTIEYKEVKTETIDDKIILNELEKYTSEYNLSIETEEELGYTINDVYGATDVVPVPMTLKKTADTINYLEYIAGAKRIAMDANNPPQNYQSKIAFAFQKKLGNNTVTTNDTLVLNYTMSPTLFQINNATYNGISVFTKNPNTDNIIKIFK